MEQECVDLTDVFKEARALTNGGYRMEFLLEAVMDFASTCRLELVWDEEEEQWGTIMGQEGEAAMVFHSELPLIFVEESRFEVLVEYIEDSELPMPVIYLVPTFTEEAYKVDVKTLEDFLVWHHSIPSDHVSILGVRAATI